jgi:hypothetical protein
MSAASDDYVEITGVQCGDVQTIFFQRAGVASCRSRGMEYDRDKVDEMVLALLRLTLAGDPGGVEVVRLGSDISPIRGQGEVGGAERRRRAPGAGTVRAALRVQGAILK